MLGSDARLRPPVPCGSEALVRHALTDQRPTQVKHRHDAFDISVITFE
jgi:hypothetical protein